ESPRLDRNEAGTSYRRCYDLDRATGSARPMGEHRRRFFGEHEKAAATKRSSGAAVFSKTANDP
ncbi:MAG TPA: hypothetical protein VHX19_11695, partial [Stellaceae bacterium]|nr:hypothetical protein [Stellaceae bacterium]